MGILPLLVALTAVGGQIAFSGAITTPTANSDASAYTAANRSASRTPQVGRFAGPPRVVRIEPARTVNAPAEIVVTYL